MPKLKTLLKYIFFNISFISFFSVFSQNAFVNYNFNSGTSYPTLSPIIAANITCSVTSTEPWQTYAGISSGQNAFDVNSVAGNAIAMVNSSGTNSRYFQFKLGGSLLQSYSTYKLYLQSQRSSTGATTITLAYSIDGVTYTNFPTKQLTGSGAYRENIFDLSSITSINAQSNLYFRLLASGASGTGVLRIDNFQIKAIKNLASTISTSIIDYVDETNKGQINVNLNGISPPYQIVWGDVKYPSPTIAYHNLISDNPLALIDSVSYKNSIEQLRVVSTQSSLLPGHYKTQVFNSLNDSVTIYSVLESKLQVHLSSGIITNTCVLGEKKYYGQYNINYLNGLSLSLQGSYVQSQNYMTFKNIFDLNKFSYVSFNVESISDKFSLGFIPKDSTVTGSDTDMNRNIAFSFNGNGTFNVFLNNSSLYNGTNQASDYFTLKTDTVLKKVIFLQNNIVILTSDISQIVNKTNLLLKVAFKSTGSKVKGIKVINMVGPIGQTPISLISSIITDVDCGNPCGGGISAQPNFFYFPGIIVSYSFELYNALNVLIDTKINTPGVFTNLCAGKYTVKYYGIQPSGAITTLVSPIIEIAYKPDWTNKINVNVSGDMSLTRNLISTLIWDTGASSFNTLHPSANTQWVEWSFSGKGNSQVGLSSNDPNQDYLSINYGIYNRVHSYAGINYYEYFIMNNGSSSLGSLFSNYLPSDIFRIEKTLNTITYKKNGIPFGYATVTLPLNDLIVDASIRLTLGSVSHPRVSFGNCYQPPVAAVPKKELDGTYYQTYFNKLLFTTDGDYSNTALIYSVYNYSRVLFSGLPITSSTLRNGDNRYEIDLISLTPGYYVLEILNQKKEKLVLRFKK